MIENLLAFFFIFLEDCFFYLKIYDFSCYSVGNSTKESWSLVDNIKSPQQLSEEHNKQRPSNPRFRPNNTVERHVKVGANSRLNSPKPVVEKEEPNICDFRPLKEGEAPRSPYNSSKKFKVILLDGSSYDIPPMPRFKSYDEFFEFRADTVQETATQGQILERMKKVDMPPLIEEYTNRKTYNQNKNYYFLIHKIGGGLGAITIIPYVIYKRMQLHFNYISGFKTYEKKFQEKAKIKLEQFSFDSEAYYFCSKYIDMSQSFIDSENYLSWVEKDGFKPLIDALEDYRNFCFENGDFDYATVLTKRIVWVSKFKKSFDKRILGFRDYKKRNPEHKFYTADTDKITNNDIREYLN